MSPCQLCRRHWRSLSVVLRVRRALPLRPVAPNRLAHVCGPPCRGRAGARRRRGVRDTQNGTDRGGWPTRGRGSRPDSR
ncbi:predicted protein [Streptomyces albidoflavus]|nr:predicted protein [Streptomyces albidoflavus]